MTIQRLSIGRRAGVILLALSMVFGSIPTFAAENVSVDDAETTFVSDTESSNSANDTDNTTDSTETVQTSEIQNSVEPLDEYKALEAELYASELTVKFSIKHPEGAPEGRVVVELWDGEHLWTPSTKYKKIGSDFPEQKNWTCTIKLDSLRKTGLVLDRLQDNYSFVRCYVEELQDGEYVKVDDSVTDTYITWTPSIYASCASNGIQLKMHVLTYSDYLLPEDQRPDYEETGDDYYMLMQYMKIFRKAGSQTTWSILAEKEPTNVDWADDYAIFVDTSVTNGKKYTYSYQSYRPAALYPYDEVLSHRSPSVTYYFLNQPKGLKAKNSSSGKTMTISWNRNSKATGYEVRYSTTGKMETNVPGKASPSKTRTVSGYKNNSLKLKNRTPDKQYWIQVRSYKTVNGVKYYSAWSDVQTRYETE